MSFKAAPAFRVECRAPFFSRQDGVLGPWGLKKFCGLPTARKGIVTLDNCWEEKRWLWCKSVCWWGDDRTTGWYQPQHLVSNPAPLSSLSKQLPYWITAEVTAARSSSGQGRRRGWVQCTSNVTATRPGERGSLPQTQCHPGCSLNHRLSVCPMTDFPACPSACAHTLPDSHSRVSLYHLRSCRAMLSHCGIKISLSCHHVYWLLHWLRACMLSPVCLASGYLSEPVNEILLLWMWLAELVVASVNPPRIWKGWFSYF